MSSEGSREIEAARKRLSSAKAYATSAAETTARARALLSAAEDNLRHARAQEGRAARETEEAAASLRESERRWAVIDVDTPGADAPRVGGTGAAKRRKVTLSPQVADAVSSRQSGEGAELRRELEAEWAAAALAASRQSDEVARLRKALEAERAAAAQAMSQHSEEVAQLRKLFEAEKAAVDAYGIASRHNDQYVFTSAEATEPLLCARFMCSTLHDDEGILEISLADDADIDGKYRETGRHEGAFVYEKSGRWNGKQGSYIICQGRVTDESERKCWFLGFFDGNHHNRISVLYRNSLELEYGDWIMTKMQQGVLSSSQKRVTREIVGEIVAVGGVPAKGGGENTEVLVNGKPVARVTVTSSGIAEANGTYQKFEHFDGVSVYRKTAQWEGVQDEFWIFRRTGDWHLAFGGKRSDMYWVTKPKWLYVCDRSYRTPKYNVPPKTGWKLKKPGRGVLPPPQLSWE